MIFTSLPGSVLLNAPWMLLARKVGRSAFDARLHWRHSNGEGFRRWVSDRVKRINGGAVLNSPELRAAQGPTLIAAFEILCAISFSKTLLILLSKEIERYDRGASGSLLPPLGVTT